MSEAEAALERKDYTTAEQKLRQATSLDARDHIAWYNLGYLYNATGRKAEAIEAYLRSVEANPKVFESNLNAGLLLASSGDLARAETYLRAATALKPASDPVPAISRAYLALARVLEARSPQEALATYEKAIQLDPSNAELHLSAGALYERSQNADAATRHYQHARKLDPRSEEALLALVNLHAERKDFAAAETELRSFLEVNPSNTAARVQLGRVLAAAGKHSESATELEAARGTNAEDPLAIRELARTYSEAGKAQEAATLYNKLLQQNPNDVPALTGLAEQMMKLARHQEAQQALIAAIKLEPKRPELYANLAISANANKNYPLALRALDARAKLAPETPSTHFLRATLYDRQGAVEKAVEHYKLFLEVAGGKFPDQEWQAQHRLKAIGPKR